MTAPAELLTKVETVYAILTACATGAGGGDDEGEYRVLRAELLEDPELAPFLPRFVTTCRDLSRFWSHIKQKFSTYQARRDYLAEEFAVVFSKLEGRGGSPGDSRVSETLSAFDVDSVHATWTRALERRMPDPEGAITSARTLLETVCKHILDESAIEYESSADLPKLYRLTVVQLRLAPDQHQEHIFRQILGGCQSVVEGLGAVRNRLGDAHGKGRLAAKPSARHAELAVNLAGAMATFLVETWVARSSDDVAR